MATLYVNGPANIWAGVGANGAPLFVGNVERTVAIEFRPTYTPVMCDLGGQRVPVDQIYDGEDAVISGDLTRFNESVYQLMTTYPGSKQGGAATRGINVPGDIGSLMLTEGLTFQLWIDCTYKNKAFQAGAAGTGIPRCYHFLNTYCANDSLPTLGTTAKKVNLRWHCLRSFTLDGANNFGLGRWSLYDNSDTAIQGAIN